MESFLWTIKTTLVLQQAAHTPSLWDKAGRDEQEQGESHQPGSLGSLEEPGIAGEGPRQQLGATLGRRRGRGGVSRGKEQGRQGKARF